MKKLIKNTYVLIGLALLFGAMIGWLLKPSNQTIESSNHQQIQSSNNVWTCSMHPSVRQNEPGRCPICGMELIPLDTDHSDENPLEIKMSSAAMKLANIQTSVIEKQHSVKEIRLNGKVQIDEQNIFTQTSHISGRIEKLMVSTTGEYVSKGQVIAHIYSPELVTAQEELFEAYKIRETQPGLYNASREKLKNWKLTEKEIDAFIERGKPSEKFPISADISGVVTKKNLNLGDYVKQGASLYEIADLTKLWILFDVYEREMPWVNVGDEVSYTVQSLPGQSYTGKINFIDPVINPRTRVAKARISVRNTNSKLKPEMFVSGIIKRTPIEGEASINVPKSAVMWTGKRSVVYVKTTSDVGVAFVMREVTLGPSMGDRYIIEEGLNEGEEIATYGTFSIDAAAQLAGKPSMMSPASSAGRPEAGAVMTGHAHGAAASMKMDHSSHEIAVKQILISAGAKKALLPLFESYLELKDALVNDNFENSIVEARKLRETLDGIPMTLFEKDAHNLWMQESVPLKALIERITSAKTIDGTRKLFKPFSMHMINIGKAFNPMEKLLFIQHCPMADDFNGADWLSTENNIMNPYYGESMLTCGEVTDTIQ